MPTSGHLSPINSETEQKLPRPISELCDGKRNSHCMVAGLSGSLFCPNKWSSLKLTSLLKEQIH